MYIAWYGLGRAFIEGLRTDSLMLGPIRISQLIGALAFAVGLFFLIFFARKNREEAPAAVGVSTLDIVYSGSVDTDADEVIAANDQDREFSGVDTDTHQACETSDPKFKNEDEDVPPASDALNDGDKNGENN
jgi:phosphatidylglycerol:prolipoprotein diacylglycerol transferase